MKIDLNQKIFQRDPYKEFARRYNVSEKLWVEMYHNRYLWHNYEIPILTEYFTLKTGNKICERSIRRWIKRTEVYNKAQKAITMGVRIVTPEYFDNMTEVELKDLCK